MSRRALVLALFVLLALPAAASADPYVVTLRDSVPSVGATVDALRKGMSFPAPEQRYSSALKGFSAELTAGQVAKVRANPAVAFVQPDVTYSATGMQALAAGETAPPGVRRVGAATTALAHATPSAAIAVLDTGVDLANPDLDAVSGTNCVKPGTPAQDDNGHGTNVAGIAAARNTGAGVVGVAPGARIYAVKILGNRATGTLSQFLCGINWVTANAAALGIRVANMSVAGTGSDDGNCGNTNGDAEHKAICASVAAGVAYAVSAGNSAVDFARTIPAAYREVLTVTAITDTDGQPGGTGPAACTRKELDDRTGSYSSFAVSPASAAHTIAAPGTCVVSTGLGGGSSTYTGTSQAAPHAAAAVALCQGTPAAPGPCAGLSAAAAIARVRSDAAAAATVSNGFSGDLLRPLAGKAFGPLLSTAAY
jgi:subtilisin